MHTDNGSDINVYHRPPKKKLTKAEIVVALVASLIILFTITGVYVWVSSLCTPCPGVELYNLSGSIILDEEEKVLNLTLTHNGGPPLVLEKYAVTVDGNLLEGPQLVGAAVPVGEFSVGEFVYWLHRYSGDEFVIGGSYTVKVIEMSDNNIAWQKSITAIEPYS